MEHEWRSKLKGLSLEWAYIERRHAVLNGLSTAFSSLAGNLCMWAVLVICIPLVYNGELPGQFLAAVSLGAAACFEAALPMQQLFYRLGESRAAADRIFEILQNKRSGTIGVEAEIQPKAYGISIRNLFVRYPGKLDWAIGGMDLELP